MKEVTLQATSAPDKAKPVNGIKYSNYMLLLRLATWLLPYIVPHLFKWLNCLEPKLGCLNKHKLRCFQKQWKHCGRGNHSLCPIFYNCWIQFLMQRSQWTSLISQSLKDYHSRHPLFLHGNTTLHHWFYLITWDGKRMRQLSANLRHLGRSTFLI